MQHDEFLSTPEAAKILGVHPNTVTKHIADGRLPAERYGKNYRVRKSDVLAMIQRFEPTEKRQARVIVVANQKGGSAKTTTAVNLSAALGAYLGQKVLLIDLDPQAGCALCVGIDTRDYEHTIIDVLDESVSLQSIIETTPFGFDLAPSNIHLAPIEVHMEKVWNRESALKRHLQDILPNYDYILIDTPPFINLLLKNALTAAHSVLIPMAVEFMTLRGLDDLLEAVRLARKYNNPELKIEGVLATKHVERTRKEERIDGLIEDFCKQKGFRFFPSVIKNAQDVKYAPGHKTPLVLWKPEHECSLAYMQVAEEVLNGKA
jgi:chromosome partitioning protein